MLTAFTDLLDRYAPPDVAATWRLGGGAGGGFVVLWSAPEFMPGRGTLAGYLLALCNDGGPPLTGKRWWAGRGFVALTGVIQPTSGEVRDLVVDGRDAYLIEMDARAMDDMARVATPGVPVSISFDAFRRRVRVGIDLGRGEVEWY